MMRDIKEDDFRDAPGQEHLAALVRLLGSGCRRISTLQHEMALSRARIVTLLVQIGLRAEPIPVNEGGRRVWLVVGYEAWRNHYGVLIGWETIRSVEIGKGLRASYDSVVIRCARLATIRVALDELPEECRVEDWRVAAGAVVTLAEHVGIHTDGQIGNRISELWGCTHGENI